MSWRRLMIFGPYLLIVAVAGFVFEHEQSERNDVDRKVRKAAAFFCARSNEVRTHVRMPLLECESLSRFLEEDQDK